MTYDEYKLATPPDDTQCEQCGEWGHGFRLFYLPGEKYGECLCPDCYQEKEQELIDEQAAAFAQMSDEL